MIDISLQIYRQRNLHKKRRSLLPVVPLMIMSSSVIPSRIMISVKRI